MNKYLFLFILLLLAIACDENKPVVPCLSCEATPSEPGGTDTIVKGVLLEEFTGVRCVNCPQAQSEIKNLQSEDIYGQQLVAISYHAGFFSAPFPQSKEDYQTEQGDAILELLGQPLGFPSGVINRTLFSGEDDLQIEQFSAWGGFVSQLVDDPARIRLELSPTFNANTRLLNVSVSAEALDDWTEPLTLHLMLAENKLIDWQLTPDGINEEYEHNHVFRAAITTVAGAALETPLLTGQTDFGVFSFNLPANWVAENCEVIAFVQQLDAPQEIVQAIAVPLLN